MRVDAPGLEALRNGAVPSSDPRRTSRSCRHHGGQRRTRSVHRAELHRRPSSFVALVAM